MKTKDLIKQGLKALEKTPIGRSAGPEGDRDDYPWIPEESWIPPIQVQINAELGLALRIFNEEFRGLKRPGGTDIGVARAVQLMSGGPITPRAARRMSAYFSRHQKDKQATGWGDEEKPSPGYVAWQAWGGDEGWAWARQLVKEMKNKRNPDKESSMEKPDVDFLYHVTYIKNLPGIQDSGLVPGEGSNFGGAYEGYSKDYVFFTESDGVPFWSAHIEDQAEANTDHPEDGWVPVVLSLSIKGHEVRLKKDTVGSEDAHAPSWKTTDTIDPDVLEIWDGDAWVPLLSVDTEDLNEEAKNNSEFIEEDDDGWWQMNYETFIPDDEDLDDYDE